MADFLQNKYKQWYDQIICNAKSRSSGDESHHVIPKSLGGNNNKENLVLLTHKEHFICHLLLPKFTTGMCRRKMSFALWRMRHNKCGKYNMTSKSIQIAKKEFSKSIKEQLTGRVVTWSDKMRGPRPNFNQTGLNNNNSKGTYVTPWGEFESLKTATSSAPFVIDNSTLARYCTTNNNKKYTGNRAKAWLVGKTPKECGFAFIEKT